MLGYVLDKKLEEGEDINQAITEIYGCELDPDVYIKGLNKLVDYAKANGADEQHIEIMKSHFVNKDTLTFDPTTYWE